MPIDPETEALAADIMTALTAHNATHLDPLRDALTILGIRYGAGPRLIPYPEQMRAGTITVAITRNGEKTSYPFPAKVVHDYSDGGY